MKVRGLDLPEILIKILDYDFGYVYLCTQKKGGGGFDAYGIYMYFVNELETRSLNVLQSLSVLRSFHMVLH